MRFQFTRRQFFDEILRLRDLMGSKDFWSKPEDYRDRAIRGITFVYLNADLQDGDIGTFNATLMEYSRRETFSLLHI